jgi:hypothetical protein
MGTAGIDRKVDFGSTQGWISGSGRIHLRRTQIDRSDDGVAALPP